MLDSQETLPPSVHLDALWAQTGITAETLAVDSNGTLTRSMARVAETLEARPPGLRSAVPPDQLGLELGPIIGRGGMGVVRIATQAALKRTVAVKAVARPTERIVSALLREAWIAGNLEHPNILPIHALTEGEQGPLLVMKRIEGVPWSSVLANPDNAPGGRPKGDLLTWHLRVFMRVCHAVHFAHTRGLLHLDIKPANVMLGNFDEVYLLDWGLAASMDADAPAWMPRAAEVDNVIGTPGYMAPELAVGTGKWIDPRTDVYLLGAVLHELITGEVLHTGTLVQAIGRAFASTPPEFLPHVPTELAAICRQAVARHRDARYQDVDALRRAVDAFLQHRHATELTEQALARLADPGSASRRQVVDEAQFGLRLALRAWPEQARARAALAELQCERALEQIEHGDLNAARASVDEMHDPPADLVQRLEAAIAARAEAEAEAARLARDNDLTLYARQRVRWLMGIGIAWLLANVGWGAIVRAGWIDFGYRHLYATSVLTTAVFGWGAWKVRHTLRTVAAERWIINAIGAGQLAIPFLWFACQNLNAPPIHAVAFSLPFYIFFMLLAGTRTDVRVRWVPLALVVPAICAPLRPEYAFEMAGLAGAICNFPAAWIWRNAADPQPEGTPAA